MSILGRLSTSQRFTNVRDDLLTNQDKLVRSSVELNTGKKIHNSYEDPQAATRLTEINSQISRAFQLEKTKSIALSELDLAESSLTSMKDIMDQIQDSALQGASDTLSFENRQNLASELRQFGETLIQLANAKVGNKFIFSGVQSNLQTVTLPDNAAFITADFKNGQADIAERSIEGLTASVGLREAFAATAQDAIIQGTNNPLTVTGDITLIVDDGHGNIVNTGNINFAADNMANVVAKINAAFIAAGGLGSVAQESPVGFLNLDTSLVTGSTANQKARISIGEGTLGGAAALTSLGINAGTSKGVSAGVLQLLTDLENAYNSNDSAAIRTSLVDLESNLDRMIAVRANIGELSARLRDSVNRDEDIRFEDTQDKSKLETVEIAKAASEFTKAQKTLEASVNMATNIFQQNIFNFINF